MESEPPSSGSASGGCLGSRADVPRDRPVLFLQVKKHMQDLSSRVSRARHNEL